MNRLILLAVPLLLLVGCSSDSDEPKIINPDVSTSVLEKLADGSLSCAYSHKETIAEIFSSAAGEWETPEAIYGFFPTTPQQFIVAGGNLYYKIQVKTYPPSQYDDVWELYKTATGFDKDLYVVKPFSVDWDDMTTEGPGGHEFRITATDDNGMSLTYYLRPNGLGGPQDSDLRETTTYTAQLAEQPDMSRIVAFDNIKDAFRFVIRCAREKWGDTELTINLKDLENRLEKSEGIYY